MASKILDVLLPHESHTKDCCDWLGSPKGVSTSCSAYGALIQEQHTARGNYYFPHESSVYNYSLRSNHRDSSLLELKYLNYLDLSGNDFQLSPIPAFLGSMKQIQHLNLSNANFRGLIPHNLGNLSSLQVLDLNSYMPDIPPYQTVDDLTWAANLSMLEHLDMGGMDLSQAKHFSEVLFHMLPSLLVLCLSRTLLYHTHFSHSCLNSSLFTNIQRLDLSGNSFDGEFLCSLHNMTSLRFLDLSVNDYNSSSLQALLRLRNLIRLDLFVNSLHHKADWVSEIFLDKCHLKSLSLAHNNFYGELFGRLFKNLSMGYCWTHKLESLSFSPLTTPVELLSFVERKKKNQTLFLSHSDFLGQFWAMWLGTLHVKQLSPGFIPATLSGCFLDDFLGFFGSLESDSFA